MLHSSVVHERLESTAHAVNVQNCWHAFAEEVAARVMESGYAVLDGVPVDDLACPHSIMDWQSAGVGKGASHAPGTSIRGDRTFWIDGLSPANASRVNLERTLKVLGNVWAETLHLPIRSVEGHWARYENGAGYQPHLDNFKHSHPRLLSMIVYFNQDWQKAHGGELILHQDKGSPITVEPIYGRAVVFPSSDLLHEVRPSHALRESLALWFRRDDQGVIVR